MPRLTGTAKRQQEESEESTSGSADLLEFIGALFSAPDARRALHRVQTAAIRGAGAGLLIKGGMHTLTAVMYMLSKLQGKGRKREISLADVIKDTVQTTVFFAAMGSSYTAVDEGLAIVFGKDRTQKWRALVAGLVAGQALRLTGSERRHYSLATYILLRGLTLLVRTGNKLSAPPALRALLQPTRMQNGDVVLMCVAASQILYSFIMEPGSLPPTYVRFIVRMGAKDPAVWAAIREQALRNESGRAPGPLRSLVGSPLAFLNSRPARLQPVPCEFFHHGQSCGAHAASVVPQAYATSLSVYLPFYLVSSVLVHRRALLQRPAELLPKLATGVLRSSAFLSAYMAFAFAGVCTAFNLLGVNTGAVIAGSVWAGGLATLVEKKSRRMELAMYCAARALEAFIRCCSLWAKGQGGQPLGPEHWGGKPAGGRHGAGLGAGLGGHGPAAAGGRPGGVLGLGAAARRGGRAGGRVMAAAAATAAAAAGAAAAGVAKGGAGGAGGGGGLGSLFRRADVLMFSVGCAAIMHCYSDSRGADRDVFRSKYLNVLDFIFGNQGVDQGSICHVPTNTELVSKVGRHIRVLSRGVLSPSTSYSQLASPPSPLPQSAEPSSVDLRLRSQAYGSGSYAYGSQTYGSGRVLYGGGAAQQHGHHGGAHGSGSGTYGSGQLHGHAGGAAAGGSGSQGRQRRHSHLGSSHLGAGGAPHPPYPHEPSHGEYGGEGAREGHVHGGHALQQRGSGNGEGWHYRGGSTPTLAAQGGAGAAGGASFGEAGRLAPLAAAVSLRSSHTSSSSMPVSPVHGLLGPVEGAAGWGHRGDRSSGSGAAHPSGAAAAQGSRYGSGSGAAGGLRDSRSTNGRGGSEDAGWEGVWAAASSRGGGSSAAAAPRGGLTAAFKAAGAGALRDGHTAAAAAAAAQEGGGAGSGGLGAWAVRVVSSVMGGAGGWGAGGAGSPQGGGGPVERGGALGSSAPAGRNSLSLLGWGSAAAVEQPVAGEGAGGAAESGGRVHGGSRVFGAARSGSIRRTSTAPSLLLSPEALLLLSDPRTEHKGHGRNSYAQLQHLAEDAANGSGNGGGCTSGAGSPHVGSPALLTRGLAGALPAHPHAVHAAGHAHLPPPAFRSTLSASLYAQQMQQKLHRSPAGGPAGVPPRPPSSGSSPRAPDAGGRTGGLGRAAGGSGNFGSHVAALAADARINVVHVGSAPALSGPLARALHEHGHEHDDHAHHAPAPSPASASYPSHDLGAFSLPSFSASSTVAAAAAAAAAFGGGGGGMAAHGSGTVLEPVEETSSEGTCSPQRCLGGSSVDNSPPEGGAEPGSSLSAEAASSAGAVERAEGAEDSGAEAGGPGEAAGEEGTDGDGGGQQQQQQPGILACSSLVLSAGSTHRHTSPAPVRGGGRAAWPRLSMDREREAADVGRG